MYGEDRVVRKICGPNRNGITGELRTLQNEELPRFALVNTYNCGDHVSKNDVGKCGTSVGEERFVQDFDEESSDNLNVYGMIILKRILKK
jgi:hypothetical protein